MERIISRQSNSNKEKLLADLRSLTEHAQQLLASLTGDAHDGAKQARRRLSNFADQTRSKYQASKADVVKKAAATDELIQSNTYTALGIAFGAGLIFGLFYSLNSKTPGPNSSPSKFNS